MLFIHPSYLIYESWIKIQAFNTIINSIPTCITFNFFDKHSTPSSASFNLFNLLVAVWWSKYQSVMPGLSFLFVYVLRNKEVKYEEED